MARVSFAAVKRVGIALGWIVLFATIAIAVTIGISEVVPGWGGGEWFVARTGVFEVIGFGLATVVVGRWLNKYSWPEIGWRKTAFPKVFVGAGLIVAGIFWNLRAEAARTAAAAAPVKISAATR